MEPKHWTEKQLHAGRSCGTDIAHGTAHSKQPRPGHNYEEEETLVRIFRHSGRDGVHQSIPSMTDQVALQPRTQGIASWFRMAQGICIRRMLCFRFLSQNPVLVGSGLSIKPDKSGSRLETMDLYKPRNRSISSTYDS
mmetsp:Transcript_7204/g.44776  ORF Transcript_7204/g.44776 Transcript_7204/m.44776 type:complete len:138 (+) Transcript_7204:5672-6085(+)